MAFQEDLDRGRVGESLVTSYFRSIGCDVRDCTRDSGYFSADIDIIVSDGITYEVKTDYRFHETGNLALEDSVTDAHGTRKSWLWTSKAERFAFVNPYNLGRFVVIDTADLRHIARTEGLRKAVCDDGYKLIKLLLLEYDRYRDVFEVIDTEVD